MLFLKFLIIFICIYIISNLFYKKKEKEENISFQTRISEIKIINFFF
jgi:hypothetical protein